VLFLTAVPVIKRVVPPLLHDPKEFFGVDFSIVVSIGFIDHLLDLIVCQIFTEVCADFFQVAEGDVTGTVLVEQLEHLLNLGGRQQHDIKEALTVRESADDGG
jgi:hypothetical protein